jgi:TetR/AcrR family transcriptional repressor of nem operon
MARYEKGRKEETHRMVVEAASERFRKDGVDGVGVATLMSDVGLTHGGFYAHFASKEALVKEAAVFALRARPSGLPTPGESAPIDLPTFIDRYLSPLHRDRPEKGCPVAAMGSDLARRPRDTRLAFAKELKVSIGLLAAALPETVDAADRVPLATTIFGQLLGCLQLARLAPSKAESDVILEAGRATALRLAGLTPGDGATKVKARPVPARAAAS